MGRYPQTLADQLQKITGRIRGASELRRQYYSLPDHVVGFGEPGKWSACMGDSGGPLSAPTVLAPMMSSESCLSDLAPALESPASSPKSPSTEIGSPRSPTTPSKMQPVVLYKDSAILFCLLFFCSVNKVRFC